MVSLKIPNFMEFVQAFTKNFIFWFLPLLFIDIGFSGVEIGILISVFMVVSLFSSFPVGAIEDRYSIREVVFVGCLLLSVFYLGLSLFRGFFPVLFFFVLGGLGNNMVKTSIRSITYKVSGKLDKGNRMGLFQSIFGLGVSLGSITGGMVLYAIDFGPGLMIASAVLFLTAFASFFIPKVSIHRFSFWEYEKAIAKKSVILLFFPVFMFGIHWGAEMTSFSPFLKNNLGLNLFQIGLYMGFALLGMGISSYFTGRHINKTFHPKSLFFFGILISGAFHILMTVPFPLLSFIFRFVHEIGDGMVMVSYYLIMSDIFDKKIIAGESSFGFTILVLGSVLGSLAFGPIGAVYGYHWPFIITGITSLFSLLFLVEEQRKIMF